ncbi:MAG: hypothetical protein PVI86_07430 [Phycisphaerae bacterium]|jgi:hypothetical protein
MANAATILMSITASGALTGALLWLTKSWISERLRNSIRHEYDQKLAAYQAQLKGEHDTQLERLRANLQIAATEHQYGMRRSIKGSRKRSPKLMLVFNIFMGQSKAM